MSIITYDPFRSVRGLQQEINRLFDMDFDTNQTRGMVSEWDLRVDVREDEEGYHLTADLPGMNQEDIHVHVENGRLTLSGERRFEHEEKKDDYRRVERAYGRFSRSFQIPTATDATKIEASYRNGVLEVTLPKAEQAKPRAIEVKVKG
ncbi:MAG: Hsp20/alpha crystallin family protein [Magnetococcales bacterium]|nr:Hsp20/alpha crystallin family protein [Magnetococcales bacterium]